MAGQTVDAVLPNLFAMSARVKWLFEMRQSEERRTCLRRWALRPAAEATSEPWKMTAIRPASAPRKRGSVAAIATGSQVGITSQSVERRWVSAARAEYHAPSA